MAFFTERPIPERPYFKVGDAAHILGVAPSAVRYWQKEFPDHINAELSHSGQNVFTRNDVIVMAVIMNLVRMDGLSIREARSRLTEVIREHGGRVDTIEICQQFELPLCAQSDEPPQAVNPGPMPSPGPEIEMIDAVGIAGMDAIQAELAAQLAINESLAAENVSLKQELSSLKSSFERFESTARKAIAELAAESVRLTD